MSEIRWTDDQLSALNARATSLAVSAAAGSGKTAVLTQRIVRLLSDPDERYRVDVSRLCVVTFTKAAAGELEAKLYEALSQAVAENPGNAALARQLFELDRAHISTIDSFCLDLIRAYRRELGLRPGVRVCEETEEALLFREACEAGLDAFLARGGEIRRDLYALFCTAKSRDGLWAVLGEMKNKAGNLPQGEAFFRERVELLTRETEEKSFYQTRQGELLKIHAREELSRAIAILSQLERETPAYPTVAEKRVPFFITLRGALEEALRAVEGEELFRAGQIILNAFPSRQPSVSKVPPEEAPFNEFCKALYSSTIKPALQALAKDYLSTPAPERQQETLEFLALSGALAELFEEVMTRFGEKKRDRNVLSFADLPAMVLRLVAKRKNGAYVPTETGREIASRFDAVFVDEYQDTNRLQDSIFRCISDEKNLFLVGDPKQSVYRFRGAEPGVFDRYRLKSPDYDPRRQGVLSRLFLSHNFRCDQNVIRLVNDLFRVLMDEDDEKSLYKEADRLHYGKDQADDRRFPAELVVLSPKKKGSDDYETAEETETEENREAAWIADRIGSLLSGEILRADGKSYRPEDVAVIARTWKQVGKVRAALLNRGIPSAWEKDDGNPQSPEEFFVQSLLEAADNPTRDVPLLAALSSPVFRFSADDLYHLRRISSNLGFFDALRQTAAGTDPLAPACRVALDALEEVRRAAQNATPTELIFFLYRRFSIEELYGKASFAGETVRRKMLRAARAAEEGGFDSLSRFCLYLTSRSGTEDGKAGESGVRLMTIHKAKGLEFPIVFVSFLGNSARDNRARVRISSEFGTVFPLPRWGGRSSVDPLLSDLVRLGEKREELEESLRVLYVALTRAREKLILTGCPSSLKTLTRRTLLPFREPMPRSLRNSMIRAATCPLDLLFLGLRQDDILQEAMDCGIGEREGLTVRLIDHFAADLPEDGTEELAPADPAEERTPLPAWEGVQPYLDFAYAHKSLETLPKKLSVSEIVRQGREEEADLIPRALSDFQSGMLKTDAAFAGTAMHQTMQFANFAAAERDLDGELARLLQEGFITEKMAAVLDRERLAAFFCSDLYRRMAASPRVVHEKRFNVLLDGKELVGTPGEVLVQGVVDVWFEKDDGSLAIVDFKTDRVPAATGDAILTDRHGEQLRLYRRAVEAMEERKVTELLLYSFSLNRAVPVTLEKDLPG